MARIVIIGPGAIGGTVGAALVGRHDVRFCANQSFATLTLTRPGGERGPSVPVTVETDERDVRPAEWVFVCTKAHQTPSAARWLRRAVGPATRVAVLQNGVEHRERVAPFVPEDTSIVPVVVQLPAERTAPGEITLYGGAALVVADDAAGRAFCELFKDSFVKATVDGDFMSRQWEKLCLNASSGAISALTLNPDAIAVVPGLRELAKRIIEEAMAIGRAEGARFTDDFAERLVGGYLSRPGSRGNSMYYDRLAHRMLEYDARNAVLIRLGRKHGIPTPVSDTIVPLLRALCPPEG